MLVLLLLRVGADLPPAVLVVTLTLTLVVMGVVVLPLPLVPAPSVTPVTAGVPAVFRAERAAHLVVYFLFCCSLFKRLPA